MQTTVFAIVFPDSLPVLAVLLGIHAIARQRPLRHALIALTVLLLTVAGSTAVADDSIYDVSLLTPPCISPALSSSMPQPRSSSSSSGTVSR